MNLEKSLFRFFIASIILTFSFAYFNTVVEGNYLLKNTESSSFLHSDLSMCPDATPKLFGYFDPDVAPTLLYYSYIPLILVSLLIGSVVLVRDRFSLRSKFLFLVSVLFSIWSVNLILQWVLVHVKLQYFFWEITPFLELLIPVATVCFVYVFLFNKNIPKVYVSLTYVCLFFVLGEKPFF